MKTILAFVAVAVLSATGAGDDLKLGEVVSDVAMKTFDGKEFKLADFRGEKGLPTVVYFYSEHCPVKLPPESVRKVADKYLAEDSKVKFIYVFSDHKDTLDGVKAFCEKNGVKGTLVWDGDRTIAHHFGAKKVNTTHVLNAKGELKYRGAFQSKKDVFVEQAITAVQEGKDAPASDGKFAG